MVWGAPPTKNHYLPSCPICCCLSMHISECISFVALLCRATTTSRVSTTSRSTLNCSINNGLAIRPRILFCLLHFLFQLFLSLNPFSPSIMINDPVDSLTLSSSLSGRRALPKLACVCRRVIFPTFLYINIILGNSFFCLGYSPVLLNANAHCGDPRIQLLLLLWLVLLLLLLCLINCCQLLIDFPGLTLEVYQN